jgi:hypothetical protein
LIFIILFPVSSLCQKWVADTIIVDFGNKEPLINQGFNLIDAIDKRKTFPEFISVFEKKKWLVFPVDQIVKTKEPLSFNYKRKFHSDSLGVNNYIAVIHDFNVKNSTAFDRRYLSLFSTIELYRLNNPVDTALIGSFYYEGTYKQKKKEDIKEGYEFLIEDWCNKYSSDVIAVEKGVDYTVPGSLNYFRRGKEAVHKNLYASIDFFAGTKFWGADAELWFSEPEGNRVFNRNSGVIRYVNHPDFHSIGIGGNVRHLSMRTNDLVIFENKMVMLIGVNNWKDMKTVSHKFEEILYFNVSMSQKFIYNKLDKKGFVFGLGIMEDLSYVIYHKLTFNLGLTMNCAYKL